ncbi:MAG: TetR/AcrR family transcriptional regulator [Acidimicrobiales bacterium]
MSATRRIGAESSASRGLLLDAALRLMVDEGYAAVTSRRVAAEAGLKPQLVHYYFRTMDDLFVAVVRRGAAQNLERQARALSSPQPLRALWELNSDPTGTTLLTELAALANHRKAVRSELAAFAEQFRRQQEDALPGILERCGLGAEIVPPLAAPVILTGLTRIIGVEKDLGLTTGHTELRELVERWLDTVEGAPPAERSQDPEPSA